MKMDEYAIPLVEYFNNHGLKTWMSCQGHNKTNMSMYWISFTKEITEEDIIKFQMQHLQSSFKNYPSGGFAPNGRFAEILFVDSRNIPVKYWCYLAATIEAAMEDLKQWRLDDVSQYSYRKTSY